MINRDGLITLGILTVLIICVFWFYFQLKADNTQMTLEQSPAGQVLSGSAEYRDMSGNPLALSDYLGQTVVAFSWATWCPSCAKQFSVLANLADRFPQVAFLAFNRAESPATVAAYMDHFSLNNQLELVIDSNDTFFTSTDSFSTPEIVIFSPSGEVVYRASGKFTEEEINAVLLQSKE